VKICATCRTEFPTGLTCPGCGAFVVDPPDENDDVVTPGSLGGWVLPAADAPAPAGPAADSSARTGEREDADPPSRLPAVPGHGSLGGWVLPAATIPAAETPAPDRHEDPAGARVAGGSSRPGAPGPAGAPNPPPADPARPGGGTAAEPAAGREADASPTRPPRALVVGGTLAVVALVVGAVFLMQPGGSKPAPDAVAANITGTCFRYNQARTKVERSVPCTETHDGTVLAFAADLSACPDTTTAVLTAQTDTDGSRGVLCVNETT
jgi:hypothetical protein